MATFILDVISDTVCPWCFIAYKTLWRSITAYQNKHADRGDKFLINWHPFQLNPHFASGYSLDKQEYYVNKYGEERTHDIHERLEMFGRPLGINFKFGGLTGSSFDSHRLITLAKQKDNTTENEVVGALFQAFFEQEEDITNWAILLNAAKESGMDESEVEDWLAAGKGTTEVRNAGDRAVRRGVHAVPNITLQKSIPLDSSMDADEFIQLVEEVRPLAVKT